MKSCLSVILATLILVAFIGTAAFLWYGSHTTEFSEGPQATPTLSQPAE